MKHTRWAAALVAALSITAAGCGSGGISLKGGSATTVEPSTTATTSSTTATTAASSTTATAAKAGANLPAGWKTIKGDTTSVGVPPSWIDIKSTLKDPTQRAALEQAFKSQSTSTYLDSLAPAILDKVDVFVIDAGTVLSGNPSNLTITVQKDSLIKDLDTLNAVLPGQLPAVGATSTGTHRATIGGNDTLVVDYTVKTANGQATGRQYDHFVGKDLVVASFTSQPTAVDTKLWDQIAATVATI